MERRDGGGGGGGSGASAGAGRAGFLLFSVRPVSGSDGASVVVFVLRSGLPMVAAGPPRCDSHSRHLPPHHTHTHTHTKRLPIEAYAGQMTHAWAGDSGIDDGGGLTISCSISCSRMKPISE
jgi:hypothetical protein